MALTDQLNPYDPLLGNRRDPTIVEGRIKRRFANKPLTFAYIGYSPFVVRNGTVSGPAYEGLKAVTDKLGIAMSAQPSTWGEVFQNLSPVQSGSHNEDGEAGKWLGTTLDMVLDPTIPTENRPITVIPYAQIRSNMILFHKKRELIVREKVNQISDYMTSIDHSILLLVVVREVIHELSSIGRGFVVTKGVLEHDILRFFQVDAACVETLAGHDIVQNTLAALDSDSLVLLDYPSGASVLEQLDGSKTEYEMIDLFGPDFPVWAYAGFAIRSSDHDLREYLARQCNLRDSPFRQALSKIDLESLSTRGLKIIDPDDPLPPFVPFSYFPLWARDVFGPQGKRRGKVPVPYFPPVDWEVAEEEVHTGTIPLTKQDIRRFFAAPLLVITALTFLGGLLLLPATELGFGLCFGSAILAYESYRLLRLCE